MDVLAAMFKIIVSSSPSSQNAVFVLRLYVGGAKTTLKFKHTHVTHTATHFKQSAKGNGAVSSWGTINPG